MADLKGAWEWEPRQIYEEATKYVLADPGVFGAYKLALDSKNAIALAQATEQLGDNLTEASRQLAEGIASAAETIAEAGRAQERYARNLALATWALVAVTGALFFATLWQG